MKRWMVIYIPYDDNNEDVFISVHFWKWSAELAAQRAKTRGLTSAHVLPFPK